jgi:hypothetical protein
MLPTAEPHVHVERTLEPDQREWWKAEVAAATGAN